ncbi:MAG: TrmH family RNA methyltransferase [Saprospiraceae bacterium]
MPFKQLSHQEIQNAERRFPIVLVLDRFQSPENAGMAFRVAEGFGVERILSVGTGIELENKRLQRTARETASRIPSEWMVDAKRVAALKEDGYVLIGLEITDQSVALSEFDFSQHKKIALVLGSERQGIAPELLKLLDYAVAIPMYGKNSSLNVISALSIALYAITESIK